MNTVFRGNRFGQKLTGRKLALIVLGNQQWPLVKLHLEKITASVEAGTPGSYVEVDIPFAAK
jgi:hypothetical protein